VPHPNQGHGTVTIDYGSEGAAKTAQTTLAGGLDPARHPQGGQPNGKATAARVTSIDRTSGGDDPATHSTGDHLVLEIEAPSSEGKGSQAAHDTLVAVGEWAVGLTSAPGIERVWCCYSDA
jgi:hypothetical protein